MLAVPFFRQDIDYSCGPTVIQMVLRYYGVVASEKDLTEELKPDEIVGTKHRHMIEILQKNGLYAYVNNGSTIDEMAYLVRLEYPVIVHFIEPTGDVGHFAVVVGFRGDKVILNDPWNGPQFKMSIKDFEGRWRSEPREGDYRNWLLAVSDREIPHGKQYTPE